MLQGTIFCTVLHNVMYWFCYGTGDICRKVNLSVVLVAGLSIDPFSSVAIAQKGVKTVTTKSSSYLGLGLYCVQLTRFDNMDHLDVAIAKKSTIT